MGSMFVCVCVFVGLCMDSSMFVCRGCVGVGV